MFPESPFKALEVKHLTQNAKRLVIPRKYRRTLPIVLAPIVPLLKLYPVRVVRCEEYCITSVCLPCLMIDLRVVDWSRKLSSCQVLLLVLKHVVLDGSSELFRHDSLRVISAVLSKKELT